MASPHTDGETAAPEWEVVFLLDCDNTLLDNDALKADMDAQLRALLGQTMADTFWTQYEEVRRLVGSVDLPLTFERRFGVPPREYRARFAPRGAHIPPPKEHHA